MQACVAGRVEDAYLREPPRSCLSSSCERDPAASGLWEWCSDTWESSPKYVSTTDPANTARGRFRVIRGGEDPGGKYGGGTKARHYQDADARLDSVGFRVVREDAAP